jgi:hypothetical protein
MPIVSGVVECVEPDPDVPVEPFVPDDEQAVAANITTDTETASRRVRRRLSQ